MSASLTAFLQRTRFRTRSRTRRRMKVGWGDESEALEALGGQSVMPRKEGLHPREQICYRGEREDVKPVVASPARRGCRRE